MKIIGWILIVCGIITMLISGISLTFEGIIGALIPIILGGICLFTAKRNQ